jgi:hypothetical protein
MGRDLGCMADVLMRFHRSTFSKPNTKFYSDLAPCDLRAPPPNHEKGGPRQISKFSDYFIVKIKYFIAKAIRVSFINVKTELEVLSQ